MAKGQQRSNREHKKPKVEKAKGAPATLDPKAPRPKVVFGKRGLAGAKS